MSDWYQAYCNDCGWYGPGGDLETTRRTEEMHSAEYGHYQTEVHEATSGGGFEVVESSTGETDASY